MDKWPLGVFASIDAGLGVKLEVARDLGVPTIQLHAPHQATRTQAAADAFLKKIAGYGIQRLRTRWRWLLALYPLAMSTTLVYYAEHYVVDVLAGALLAALVLVGCQLWESSRDRAAVTPRSRSPRG